jgi:hypothetical protein
MVRPSFAELIFYLKASLMPNLRRNTEVIRSSILRSRGMSRKKEEKEVARKLPAPWAWLRGFRAASTTRKASACEQDFTGFFYQPDEPRNITFTEFLMKWFILGEDHTAP